MATIRRDYGDCSAFVSKKYLFTAHLNFNHEVHNSAKSSWRNTFPDEVLAFVSQADSGEKGITCNQMIWNDNQEREVCQFIAQDKVALIMHALQKHFDFLLTNKRSANEGVVTILKHLPYTPFSAAFSKSKIAMDLAKCRTCSHYSMLTVNSGNSIRIVLVFPLTEEQLNYINDYLRQELDQELEESKQQSKEHSKILKCLWDLTRHKCFKNVFASEQFKDCFDYATVCSWCSHNFSTTYQLLRHECKSMLIETTPKISPRLCVYMGISPKVPLLNFRRTGFFPYDCNKQEVSKLITSTKRKQPLMTDVRKNHASDKSNNEENRSNLMRPTISKGRQNID